MNKFTVHYPNGIKRHINKKELDLLGSTLQRISSHEYRAASFSSDLKQVTGPEYLDIHCIFERKGQRQHEREQTPKGMLQTLEHMGFTAELVTA